MFNKNNKNKMNGFETTPTPYYEMGFFPQKGLISMLGQSCSHKTNNGFAAGSLTVSLVCWEPERQ
jgi:hypothetical protein